MQLTDLATQLNSALRDKNMMLVTAESCTGGWVAKLMTDIPGSSASFDRGFVTYSNVAKSDMLGVSETTLDTHGAVSEAVVKEMTAGALQNSVSTLALAISGIAGPGGGTEDKPVGTVWFAWQLRHQKAQADKQVVSGDRDEVRQQATVHAMTKALEIIETQSAIS